MNTSNTVEIQQVSKKKILDVAEYLFARDGFSATSLRAITAEAGVNLASVNYYFGSKDHLIIETLSRAIRPLNEERIRLLKEATEKALPNPPSLEAILEAMIKPLLELAFDPKREQVTRLLERSHTEEGNFIKKIMEDEWSPVCIQFIDVIKKVLPNVSEEEIHWRGHFTIGAMIHAVCHYHDIELLSGGKCKLDRESILKRLIEFAAAGFQAPHSS